MQSRFVKDRDGNIAIMFGFMLAVLMLFAGGAVDYTRYNTIRADIVESLDAAALAMARYDEVGGPEINDLELDSDERNQKLEAYGEALFTENFSHASAVKNLDVTFNITSAKISAQATGEIQTILLQIGRRLRDRSKPLTEVDHLDMDVEVVITRRGTGQIELALVLDVTGSMDNYASSSSSQAKIDDLKDAVDNLLDVLYGNDDTSDSVKVGVVPFSAYVNAGAAGSWDDSWGDENADAAYHGARFFHVTEDGEVDMDEKVSHYALYDSADITWEGCVEARPYPLDEIDVYAGEAATSTEVSSYNTAPTGSDARTTRAFSRAPSLSLSNAELTDVDNSKFVPLFWPDEPDCDANWRGRCPWWEGYSYWNQTGTFSLGGSTETINFARYWFVDPEYDDWTEADYENRFFIDDQNYIGRDEGEPTSRYAYIVKQYRNLGEGSLSTDEQEWKDFLDALGADHYFDTDIDRDHAAFADDYANHDGDSSTANYEEYVMRNAYVGWWNTTDEVYDYKYDLSGSSGYGPEPDCPDEILPLTNDRSDIQDHVDGLSTYGFTNTANGTMWGWRVLSPGAPFDEGALYNDSDWSKAVVIMTDGTNDAGDDKNTPWGGELSAYGFPSEERMGSGVNDPDASEFSSDTDYSSSGMAEHMEEKMLRICARMKEKGIIVYSIVFGLNDTETENVFKACATDTTEPYYFKAPTGDDLETAFGQIAADLVNLHVSQ